MKVISIINLKGGVAKTISSANFGYILATIHNKRVLFIDNDKQGNLSKFYNVHSYDKKSVADILTDRKLDIQSVIQHTKYENIDIIPANMNLLKANMQVLMDTTSPQQTRFKNALNKISDMYDYCIIDNAPDINISVINGLTISDDVLIPVKIDKFSFDGLAELVEQIENTKVDLNPKLNLKGCFITMYQNNEVNTQGKEWLEKSKYSTMKTVIRRTEKVDESTFSSTPLLEYSKRCGASKDYISLVEEYLK